MSLAARAPIGLDQPPAQVAGAIRVQITVLMDALEAAVGTVSTAAVAALGARPDLLAGWESLPRQAQADALVDAACPPPPAHVSLGGVDPDVDRLAAWLQEQAPQPGGESLAGRLLAAPLPRAPVAVGALALLYRAHTAERRDWEPTRCSACGQPTPQS